MKQQTDSQVQLARPGAGLPFMELMISRIAFSFARRAMPPRAAMEKFQSEAERMLKMAGSLELAQAQTPVLIQRIHGIEDSSRNWSVLMTLDHLVIVNSAIIQVIESLMAGRRLDRVASTADVKPGLAQGEETIGKFREVVRKYAERVNKLPGLTSQLKHKHPWFGALDARGWHTLAAIHHGIHRRQIECILQALQQG